MKQLVKNIALLAFASAIAALFASCGTVRGFGRDVGTVGEGIQKSTR